MLVRACVRAYVCTTVIQELQLSLTLLGGQHSER